MAVPLSVAQAASSAGVSTKTVRRWLTSGRLEAVRGPDGAWLIEPEALEHARLTPGPSTDSPALHPGRGQDMSIVQELLDRLERQAGEIATLRGQVDQLQRALQAPIPEIAPQRDSEGHAVESTQTPSVARNGRPWWRRWR